MNRNAKKPSGPLLVAALVVTAGAASLSGLKAEAPQSSHRGQTGNVRHRTKLGKANSHVFSGANEVRGFAEATDLTDEGRARAWGTRKPGVCRKRGTRWYGKTQQGSLESDALPASYRPAN